jgi:hypothetical protein
MPHVFHLYKTRLVVSFENYSSIYKNFKQIACTNAFTEPKSAASDSTKLNYDQ